MTRSRAHDDAPPLALAGLRIERLMSIVRWTASGLVFGIGPFIPNIGIEWVMLLAGHLFILSVLITLLARHAHEHTRRVFLIHIALAGDAIGGMAAVLVFAPGPEWGAAIAVGVVLLGSGAFRGGVGGVIATFATTVVGYVGGEAIRYEAGGQVDVTRMALTLTAYAFASVVFTGWHREVRRVVADRAAVAARLTLVGRAATDIIYDRDLLTGTLTLSEARATHLGYAPGRQRLDRAWWEERLHPEDAGPVRDALATLLKGSAREWEMEYRFRKADGTYTTIHDRGYVVTGGGRRRRPVRLVGTLVNVDSVALYDPVTHLAGRALFADRVERRAVRGAIRGEPFTVVVVDVEHFRATSARIGRQQADTILTELARRLETHLRDGETLARVAHDQLAFLLAGSTPDEAIARAAQIRDSARIPFGEDGAVRLDVVAGAAILPAGGAPDLMRQAVAALADAKRTKRRVAVYEPGGERRWEERVRLRDDLGGALARRELVLNFQPIVDVRSGRCVAVEALVRWEHPELGQLDAGELLQVASDLDLGTEIDRWVLHEATRALGQLRRVRPDLRVSVNLAAATLDREFPVTLRAVLAAAMLPGDALTIELREDPALARDPAASALRALRELNVGLAIDDFGTGYASIASGLPIPATEVKVDRVFVSRLTSDEHALRIVRSTIAHARHLGVQVVAEGAEDDDTLAQLRSLRAARVQGLAIAKPMSLDAVTAWLAPASERAIRAGEPALLATAAAVVGEPALMRDAYVLEPAPVVAFEGPEWIIPEIGPETLVTEPAAATAIQPERFVHLPTAEPEPEPDPRILVLEQHARARTAPRGPELGGGSEDEAADRLDERLVLLREHARRQALRGVAG